MSMNSKLYDLMDWAEIEAITYSEESHPKKLLGSHPEGNNTLIACFFPGADGVSVRADRARKDVPMELADEAGYFAVLLKKKYPFHYIFKVHYPDGKEKVVEDPYSFPRIITERQEVQFTSGIADNLWEFMGAHRMMVDGVEGIHFAVWAPNAMRVSVVGDFNDWDGRVHEMEKLDKSGIYELFIPGVEDGDLYKYEIKVLNGEVTLKADPMAFETELRPDSASVVRSIGCFTWNDVSWIKERGKRQNANAPVAVYEMNLGAFLPKKEDGSYRNCRDIAAPLAKYLLDMGYTHVELMPVMEHPFDGTFGYQTLGYYAFTKRFGLPEDFAWFVNYMHEKKIGVILDWCPSHFPEDEHGLASFDGTCLYESEDPNRSFHPEWGTRTFDFTKPEVRSFLMSSALFWAEVYHVDGIRADGIAAALYLDYGRENRPWSPNIYGGKEYLEAIDFFREMNKSLHRHCPDVISVAEDNSGWPGVTNPVEEEGLGFDYKWNEGWRDSFLDYIHYDPIIRTHHYGQLCFSMVYAYAEKYMLPMTHDVFTRGQGTFFGRLPGAWDDRLSAFRASMAFFFTHPGKKILSQGLDMGDQEEWDENKSINFDLVKNTDNQRLHNVVKDLIHLYKDRPALHELAHEENGFEWINCVSANENILVYLRKTSKKEDTLIVLVNFENIPRKEYRIGVPFAGKYKEIFNSDAEKYGGFDFRNHRILKSEELKWDGRDNSIRVKVPPLGVSIFEVES